MVAIPTASQYQPPYADSGRAGGRGGGRAAAEYSAGLQYVARVRGLPFDCTRQDLLEFFKDANPKANGIFFVSKAHHADLSGQAQSRLVTDHEPTCGIR
jgi:hypothetical protein